MSKVTYIKTKDKHEDTSIEQGVDVHAELLNNDIDELAKAEEQDIDDNYDSAKIIWLFKIIRR